MESHPWSTRFAGTGLERMWRAEQSQDMRMVPGTWGTGCAEDPHVLNASRGAVEVRVQMKEVKTGKKKRETKEVKGETPMQDVPGKEDLELTDTRTRSQRWLMVRTQWYHMQTPVNETWGREFRTRRVHL